MQIKLPTWNNGHPPPQSVASRLSTDEALSVSLSSDPESREVLVRVIPPSRPSGSEKIPGRRAPLDICCVIDVSGSMSTEAPIPADPSTGKPAESNGLSVLDVVKHSLRTIVTTMQEDDRIALVTFSDSAKTVFNLTKMNKAGKADVLRTVEGLVTEGMTNLWDGLKMGMNLLSEDSAAASKKAGGSSSNRLSTLFILTDGMPNISPPRGHGPMLRSYLEAHPMAQPFSISTFGFAYSLDSQLLLELAQIGGGSYGFIPDAGMVGTVFIHAVANTYSTYAPRAHLDIEVLTDTEIEVKGRLPVIKTSWGIQIDAGDIQFGQTRDFVLVVPESHANISATLTYRPFDSATDIKVQAVGSAATDLASIKYHAARLDFVDALFAVPQINDLPTSTKALTALRDRLSSVSILANHTDALALGKDIAGEGLLALKDSSFQRWGRHYLPSLARSHQRQQSGNFKDPGLQVYGRDSSVFLEERDKLDSAFDALPPPKPSLPSYSLFGQSSSKKKKGFGAVFGAPGGVGGSSMSVYHSPIGPCFSGNCFVKMPGDAELRVDELKRGMEIETIVGPRKVAAILRTSIPSGEALLCKIGDLVVTPWHPISWMDGWKFPADIAKPEIIACDAVYSVLLLPCTSEPGKNVSENANAHTISVSGVWCVTLGHGITTSSTGDVRAHAFLGDYERVLRDISSLSRFYEMDGVVYCAGTRRSGIDQRICGFVGEGEVTEMKPIVEQPRILESV